MDSSRAWTLFVAAWVLVGGVGQLTYTIAKGHIYNPWSRERFESNSCLFWVAMAGSVGGILLGALILVISLA